MTFSCVLAALLGDNGSLGVDTSDWLTGQRHCFFAICYIIALYKTYGIVFLGTFSMQTLCMQLKLRDFMTRINSLSDEIKMCRICTSYVSCGSGEMLSGATGGEFDDRLTS